MPVYQCVYVPGYGLYIIPYVMFLAHQASKILCNIIKM